MLDLNPSRAVTLLTQPSGSIENELLFASV